MAGLLGQSVLPPEIQALLLERAGGNPLYAEEFVRLLSDRGLLVRSGRVVRLATTAAIPFLDTVQALIAARLDMLPAGGKALVQDAAVVGRVFWPGALAALAGTAEPAVLAGLAALAARELVQEVRPSSVEGQAEYRFSHGLVKDVAYAQIPRVGRARRHRAVAGWLEGLAGERVADLAEVIAYHSTPRPWPSPGRPAAARPSWPSWPDRPGGPWSWPATAPSPSTWPGPGGSTPRPSSCSRPATRNGTSCCRGSAGSPSRRGRLADARQAYEQALAGFRAAGDRVGQGNALNRLSTVLWNQGETARTRAVLTEAVGLLEPAGPGPELGEAYAHLAFDWLMSGQAEEGRAWADRALKLARRLGRPELEVRSLDARGLARTDLGDPGGLEDLRAALANCRDGLEFAERRGLTEIAVWVQTHALGPLFDLGRWDELLDRADEVITRDRAHGGRYVSVMAEALKGQVLVWRDRLPAAAAVLAEAGGDLERAADLHDRAADGWRRFGHLPEEGQALLGAGRCLRRLGRPPATARLEAARDLLGRLGAGPLEREAGAELAGAAGSA